VFVTDKSAAGVGRAVVKTAAGPLLYIDQVHIPAVGESEGHGDLLEVLVAAVDEDLNGEGTTSMYLVSMLRMILRQSLGFVVISPKTLLLRLLPVSE
jgi:hypothetical protein